MVFVLVLCGLVIGVYLLLIALLLVAGFYGVFGAIVYGPFFIIWYIWRVFDGEDALEKSYDVRKPEKSRVREPREVSNVRLTGRKPSKIKRVEEAKKPAVKVGQVLKPKKASNTVESNKLPRVFQSKKSSIVKPSANKTKQGIPEVAHKVEPQKANQRKPVSNKPKTKAGIPAVAHKVEAQKANPRNPTPKKSNPRKVEPQGITSNIPTTSPLTDYPDMV